ncbi:MAG: ATP-binding protein [Bryobacteraceae bacterium]
MAILVLACLAFSAGGPASGKTPKVIRTWRQLHNLTTEEARRAYPVRLRIVVTYAPPNKHHFWAQDPTGGGFAWLSSPGPTGFSLGQALDLTGVTDPGGFGPCLKVLSYRVVGSGKVPAPVVVPMPALLAGAEDGRRIQIRGRLLSLTITRTGLPLTKMVLSAGGARIPVLLDGIPLQSTATLLDADVRLAASSSVRYNDLRQFTGIVLNLGRPEDLTVLSAGSKDIPVTQIDDLLRYRPGDVFSNPRSKIEGIVTYNGGKLLVIQNGGRAAFAQLTEPSRIGLDRWASVLGYPRARGYTPTLIDARVYPGKASIKVTPRPTTIAEARSGRFDALLVRMKAELMDHSYSRAQQFLELRDGDSSFMAQLPPDSKDYVSKLKDGSVIELTGVIRVQFGNPNNTPQAFQLLLRSDSDVSVLQRPSWFSRTRLLLIALALAAVVACVLVWVTLLRRQVLRQTRKLLEQRHREAQLERNRRLLFENATDLIFTLTTEGRFLSANPATAKVTGWAIADLVGTHLRDLILPEQRESYGPWFEALFERSYSSGEFDIRTLSGSIRTIDLSAHVSNSSPEHPQIEFIGRDVTERKRRKAALEQARQAAETANAGKTRFLANMSHEIRTPLNAILGMADLLAETNLTSDQRSYVSTFQNSGNSLLSLLNGILDLTKVESGQLELESIPFHLENLVKETVNMMTGKIHSKKIRLVWNIDRDVPLNVVGDPNRLRQILTNLLGNAIKFTDRGEVRVDVGLAPVPPEAHTEDAVALSFLVKDTGVGIASEKFDLIFERFTQADNSTTRRFGGTGLGLSISKGLAQAMGGSIEVRSTLGQGSEFLATLSFGRALTTENESPARTGPSHTTEALEALRDRPASILLAEDNEANRLVIEAYLKDLPFVVDSAPNGLKAVEMEARNNYDLILMDIEMPEMDGHEATRRILARRRHAGLPEIPILALTAHAFDDEKGASALAGCSELLTKPIRRKALLSVLSRYLTDRVPENAVL